MRTPLLTSAASASLLALSASLSTASATTIGFTSQIVDYTVPNDGTYRIVATGAQGGTETHSVGGDSVGGTGERVSADFSLTMNEVLRIAVGGKGGDGPSSILTYGAGGGGGGTFVLGPGSDVNSILLVAGGGGGGGAGEGQGGLTPEGLQARDGVPGKGLNGSTISGGAAGSNGMGGAGGSSDYYIDGGGGGGGFIGNGGVGGGSQGAAGGNSFANGLGGGGSGTQGGGGFGGGGGGGQDDKYGGGGGGGGYDGGGGGVGGTGGGSGGSFFGIGATNMLYAPIAMPDGNGSVIITELPSDLSSPASVPEPASLAVFGTGALSLLALRRARRR